VPGVKKVSIASGVRYDLASESPEYIKELATHHTGGYLKIAPEHTEDGPLDAMMKPGIGTYDRFKSLFDKFSKEAGKEQYVIPYFIAAHPGTTDKDMLNLALWLKRHDFRADQVQAFLPTPMTFAAAMYHTGMNPMKRDGKKFKDVYIPKSVEQRRLHKAFLRWHDANNWPLLRQAHGPDRPRQEPAHPQLAAARHRRHARRRPRQALRDAAHPAGRSSPRRPAEEQGPRPLPIIRNSGNGPGRIP
jgi:radical SAM superfamily enzyme YgiQ (UPF0313 family)